MKKRYGRDVYVQSAGMASGDLDDIMVSVMAEKGIDMNGHHARTLGDLGDKNFDHVIAFTEAAGEAAKAVFEDSDTVIEVWAIPDPTTGSLDVRAMMNNYRAVRDYLDNRLERHFTPKAAK